MEKNPRKMSTPSLWTWLQKLFVEEELNTAALSVQAGRQPFCHRMCLEMFPTVNNHNNPEMLRRNSHKKKYKKKNLGAHTLQNLRGLQLGSAAESVHSASSIMTRPH